jgi:hypothetical protein
VEVDAVSEGLVVVEPLSEGLSLVVVEEPLSEGKRGQALVVVEVASGSPQVGVRALVVVEAASGGIWHHRSPTSGHGVSPILVGSVPQPPSKH